MDGLKAVLLELGFPLILTSIQISRIGFPMKKTLTGTISYFEGDGILEKTPALQDRDNPII